jgi:hypothetical protein
MGVDMARDIFAEGWAGTFRKVVVSELYYVSLSPFILQI